MAFDANNYVQANADGTWTAVVNGHVISRGNDQNQVQNAFNAAHGGSSPSTPAAPASSDPNASQYTNPDGSINQAKLNAWMLSQGSSTAPGFTSPTVDPLASGNPIPGTELFNSAAWVQVQAQITQAYNEAMLKHNDQALALQAATAVADEAIKRAGITQQAFAQALQAATASSQQGISALQLVGSLTGPRNAFQQQDVLHGLNAQGYSNAIDAIAGKYNVPAYGQAHAAPQGLTLQSMAEDAQGAGAGGLPKVANPLDLALAAAFKNAGINDPVTGAANPLPSDTSGDGLSQAMQKIFEGLGWGNASNGSSGSSSTTHAPGTYSTINGDKTVAQMLAELNAAAGGKWGGDHSNAGVAAAYAATTKGAVNLNGPPDPASSSPSSSSSSPSVGSVNPAPSSSPGGPTRAPSDPNALYNDSINLYNQDRAQNPSVPWDKSGMERVFAKMGFSAPVADALWAQGTAYSATHGGQAMPPDIWNADVRQAQSQYNPGAPLPTAPWDPSTGPSVGSVNPPTPNPSRTGPSVGSVNPPTPNPAPPTRTPSVAEVNPADPTPPTRTPDRTQSDTYYPLAGGQNGNPVRAPMPWIPGGQRGDPLGTAADPSLGGSAATPHMPGGDQGPAWRPPSSSLGGSAATPHMPGGDQGPSWRPFSSGTFSDGWLPPAAQASANPPAAGDVVFPGGKDPNYTPPAGWTPPPPLTGNPPGVTGGYGPDPSTPPVSSGTPADPSSWLSKFPDPGQVDFRQWNNLDPDTQQFLLGGWAKIGWGTPENIQWMINQTAPGFSAPTVGSVANGG